MSARWTCLYCRALSPQRILRKDTGSRWHRRSWDGACSEHEPAFRRTASFRLECAALSSPSVPRTDSTLALNLVSRGSPRSSKMVLREDVVPSLINESIPLGLPIVVAHAGREPAGEGAFELANAQLRSYLLH